MKRAIAITAFLAVACPVLAAGQSSQPQTLGEVAKAEEARRKNLKKPAKVYTNDSLKPDITVPVPPPAPPAGATASTNTTPSNTTPTISGGQAKPADPAAMKDQAFWSGRIAKARADLNRLQIFADSLQSRINALTTDFVNRDNRVEREKIEKDRSTALAELERVKKDMATQQKAITDIEDEARRAGVPAGWLRPPS